MTATPAHSTSSSAVRFASCSEVLNRNLVFVHGKGGVGKTAIAQAAARVFAERGKKTLCVGFEDPTRPRGELTQSAPNLWELNADAMKAFEEYATMKVERLGLFGFGALGLTKVFVHNKLIQYLAKAAPGIHELVLLGKVWFERKNYDHVIVDMPSTGYGLAMFQSTINFAKLFHGGPLNRDADAMLATMRDPSQCGNLIVALPEEMPLRESLDLNAQLIEFFPENFSGFLLNRAFPRVDGSRSAAQSNDSAPPFAVSIQEYAERRSALERQNMALWKDAGIGYGEIDYFAPGADLLQRISRQMIERKLL